MTTHLREPGASRTKRVATIALGLALGCLLWPEPVGAQRAKAVNPAVEGGAARRVGRLFKVPLPIAGTKSLRQSVLNSLERLRDEKVRPVLIFEFVVAKGQNEYGRGTTIGNAYDLADFLSGKELGDVETVAYVPQTIQGHAVLAVMACQTIIMNGDAELGPAGVDETQVPKSVLSSYEDIAARRKKVPVEVALKLVDASRELLEVETDVGKEYVTPETLSALRKKRTVSGESVVFRAGQPAQFSGTEARQRGFVDHLALNHLELARALEVSPESLKDAAPLDGQWRSVRVDVKGPIRADLVDKAERMVREAIERQEANFVCLWIDSAGGSPIDSQRLAGFLSELDSGRVRTVAYVPREARADAALVALACDQIVVHPGAVLGGEGDHAFAPEEVADMTRFIRNQVAPNKSRSWSLPAAMFDPNLTVIRCRRGSEVEYFCDEELNEQAKPERWVKAEEVTTKGQPFRVKGTEAVELRLATHEVNDFAGFRELYGLENDPTLLEPNWADMFIEALASPGLAVLLLVIGGVALYAELHSPGIGVPGFIATLCFVLFFWSRFLGGTAGWLEVLLFLLGVTFLMLEIFVIPGFGIFGLGGGALLIASLVLASQTFVIPRNEYQAAEFRNSLVMITASGIGIIAVILLINRWLPHTPVLSQLILNPPTHEEAEAISQSESLGRFDDLLGARGIAVTPLVPGGKARFGRNNVDVLTDGEFVPRGTEVEVVEVQGNRVLVRPLAS
jgi:membrane-bound ClpP family serine protease